MIKEMWIKIKDKMVIFFSMLLFTIAGMFGILLFYIRDQKKEEEKEELINENEITLEEVEKNEKDIDDKHDSLNDKYNDLITGNRKPS